MGSATAGDEERFLCSENQFLLHLQHPMPVNSGGKSFLLPVAPETTSFPFETWKVEQSSVFGDVLPSLCSWTMPISPEIHFLKSVNGSARVGWHDGLVNR